MYYNGKLWIVSHLYFPFLFRISIPVLDELVLEVVARHRDDILAQPPDQDTLRTDSTFCGDMGIWEQETGVLYQVHVYGDKGEISRPTWTVCWLHAWKTRIDNPK